MGDGQEVKPWSEIARNFDPMMPKDTYDNLRLHYFHNFVAPKVAKGTNVDATWEMFKQKTERPSLLPPGGKATLYAQTVLAGAAEAGLAPLKDLDPKFKDLYNKVQAKEVDYGRMAARESINIGIARGAGELAGTAVDFALLSRVLGPIAGGLASEMSSAAKTTELIANVTRGGLAFGTYDALAAGDKENRLLAGVKGFAIGAGIDLALASPGYLMSKGVAKTAEEAESIIQDAASGKPPEAKADVAITDKVKHDADVSRRELRPDKGSTVYTTGKRGARMYVTNIAGDTVPLEIRPNRESEVYYSARAMVDQGGSVSHYEVHPEDTHALNEYVRIQSGIEEAKYRGTVVKTPLGEEKAVATKASAEGLPAQVVGPQTVEVQSLRVEHPIMNKVEEANVPKIAEAKPTKLQFDTMLDKKGYDAKQKMFMERQFEHVWDPELSYEQKRTAAIVLGRYEPDLLPKEFKNRLNPPKPEPELMNDERLDELLNSYGVNRTDVDVEPIRSGGEIELNRQLEVKKPELYAKNKEVGRAAYEKIQQERGGAQASLTKTYYHGTSVRAAQKAFDEGLTGPVYAAEHARYEKGLSHIYGVVKGEELNESNYAVMRIESPHPFELDPEHEAQDRAMMYKGNIPKEWIKEYRVYDRQSKEIFRATRRDPAFLAKIPASEQREYSRSGNRIASGGRDYPNIQAALDDAGDSRFVGAAAGRVSAEDQIHSASLSGRLLGSIENVGWQDMLAIDNKMKEEGWMYIPLKGKESGKYEVVYFRPQDHQRLANIIDNYDQYVSKQAGRAFDSRNRAVGEVGPKAHDDIGKAFGIAGDERAKFNPDEVVSAPELQRKPVGNRLMLQHEDMSRLYAGAEGLAVPNMDEFVKTLGVEVPPSWKGGEPVMVLTPESSKSTIFHERLHINGMYSGVYDRFPQFVGTGSRETALDISKGLRGEFDGYRKATSSQIIEEAFTHAATALRYGDKPYLDKLAKWDTDIDHVLDFINSTSTNLLEKVLERSPHGDSVPVRIYQRTLFDLTRRSSHDVSEALRQGFESTNAGVSSWYDAETDMWVLKESHNREAHFKDVNGLWDHLFENDKNFMAPSASLRSELGGVRGPIAPIGREPSGMPLPVPEIPPEGKFVGASAASAMWRPFFPWLSSLHENMNALFKKSGKYLPLYETAKAVDDGFRVGDEWLLRNAEQLGDLLKPFKGKKQRSVFDYLTYPEKERTDKLLGKYGLTREEGQQAHKLWEYMNELGSKTGINVKQYMLEYHPKLRGFGWAPERVFGPETTKQTAGFFDKLIRHEGKWDPQDAHIGRFMHTMLREGMEKQYTGKALNEFEKLIERKSPDGTYLIPQSVRWPMSNYARYMRNIPDTSQQIITKSMEGFFNTINDKIKTLNEHLPKGSQLPTMDAPPRQVLNRFMLLSYSMGLGMRPAIAVRDTFQAFTGGMTVLGPKRFMSAFTKMMMNPRDLLEAADKAGALLRKNNVGELMGDIMGEVPTEGPGWTDRLAKWSNQLLAPSRWGHNFGRAIMYTGEYSDALDAIRAYRRGALNVDDLMEKTSLWFMDKPAQSMLLKLVGDSAVPVEDAARKIALEAVDLTQWPYRRGTQPTLLRYGMGRIFGQYAVWPANYADFLYRIGKKWTERPGMAARTSATWVAVQYALSHSMEAVGADTSRWFWQSPAGFAGSPHWDFVHALMVAPENSDEGRAARKTILEYPLDFVPAYNEMRAVTRAIQDNGMDSWPPDQASTLRALGFKPLDQATSDQEWDDFVKTQLGYENTRRRK